MSTIKVAINGFGRIGRNLFKLLHHHENIEVVAINDLADAHTLSHLLKFDSIHGIFDADIRFRESVQNPSTITVNSKEIPLFNSPDIKEIPWHTVTPDIVIEATGKYKTTPELEHHIKNGAKKVILAVPPQDDQIKMVVLGVNDHIIESTDTIISNASCTTNNAAPMIKVIDELCGVEQAYITTVHSYTTDQSLHDQPHRDLRRARAAGQSIVPTTTGAAKALTKVFPHLANVIGGCGIRVPIANGSLTDITFNVKKDTSIEVINKALEEASQTHLKGIIEYTDLPIVSVDIIGNTHSCVFDSQMTSVIGKMVKIIGWYDNEIGYSSRIIDLILFINRK
ncbi:type I glyceraldehyde-3-phosphate dehydrogenase [uncultured Dokdonia sp.]|uniref:type I glyceraldehyde-3-phosphate dehydrogenase n=1 Tax=uncultured Dokdonia sp. TaxID=575653 RepID=UPI00260CAD4D|nr:type I glyceraldehyde-3-phosphate dehydrogenase [uncultured Dokdonia sp.]